MRLRRLAAAALAGAAAGGTAELTPAPASYAEEDLRQGRAVFTLTLSGDTWTGSNEASLIAGMSAPGADPAGWQQRKGGLVRWAYLDAATLTAQLGPDPGFDCSVKDTVTISVPGGAVTSGQPPAAALGTGLTFSILPSPGALSQALLVGGQAVAPPQLPEAALFEKGNVELRLTLAPGETWAAASSDPKARLSLLAGLSGGPGWELHKDAVVGAPAVSADGLELRVPLYAGSPADPAPGPASAAVSVQVPGPGYPGTLVRSGLRPTGQPWEFTLQPSAAAVTASAGAVQEVSEERLRQGGLRLTFALSDWETWDASAVSSSAAAASWAAAPGSGEAAGWDARRAALLPAGALSLGNPRQLVAALAADRAYDISRAEVVTLAFSPAAVASRIAPDAAAGGWPQLRVTPSEGRWALSGGGSVSAAQLRSGGLRLRITLEGETWSPTGCAEVLRALTVNPASQDSGFAARRQLLLPPAACSATGQAVAITFAPDAQYDPAAAETITLAVPAAAVASGLAPQPPPAAAARTLSVAPSPQPPTPVVGSTPLPPGATPAPRWAVPAQSEQAVVLAPPPYVSRCAPAVTLDASRSSFGTLTPPALRWSAPAGGHLAQMLSAGTPDGQGRLLLRNASLLAPGQHAVCAQLGAAEACAELTVLPAGPLVLIEEAAPSSVLSLSESSGVGLHAVPLREDGCGTAQADRATAYTYSWTPPTAAAGGSASRSALWIPPYTLRPGAWHAISVAACPTTGAAGAATQCAQGRVVVWVGSAPLSVAVDQGVGVALGRGAQTALSARAARGREAVPLADLQWRCSGCLAAGGDLAAQGPRLALSHAALRLGRHSVVVSAQHELSAASARVTLSVLDGANSVAAAVSAPSHASAPPTTEADYSLYAAVLAPPNASAESWNWACEPAPRGSLGATGAALLAPAGAFPPGVQHTCEAAGTLSGATIRVAAVIQAAPAPTGGTCAVSPPTGAQGAAFRLSCSGWTAPGGGPLRFRFTRVYLSGQQADLSGGPRGAGELAEVWLASSNGVPGLVSLMAYVGYDGGSSAAVPLYVTLTGGTPAAATAAATASTRWANGDAAGALSAATAAIHGGVMQLNSSGAEVAAVLSAAASSAEAPGEVSQALAAYCVLWPSSWSPATAAALAPQLAVGLRRLAARMRLHPSRVGAAADRRCAAQAAGAIARGAAPQDAAAGGALQAAVAELLSAGPAALGAPAELTEAGTLSVSHATLAAPAARGGLEFRPPFAANLSLGVALRIPSAKSAAYSAGIAAWRALPQGAVASVVGANGARLSTPLASQVVGAAVRVDGAALPAGVPVLLSLPLLLGPLDSHRNLLAVYWDPDAAVWRTDGVRLYSAASGVATIEAQHLTDFAVVRSVAAPGTAPPSAAARGVTPAPAGSAVSGAAGDDGVGQWWVWLIVVVLVMLLAAGCLFLAHHSSKQKEPAPSPGRARSASQGSPPFAPSIPPPAAPPEQSGSLYTAGTRHLLYDGREDMRTAQAGGSGDLGVSDPSRNPIDDQWAAGRWRAVMEAPAAPCPVPPLAAQPYQPEPAHTPIRGSPVAGSGAVGYSPGAVELVEAVRHSPSAQGSFAARALSFQDEPGA